MKLILSFSAVNTTLYQSIFCIHTYIHKEIKIKRKKNNYKFEVYDHAIKLIPENVIITRKFTKFFF